MLLDKGPYIKETIHGKKETKETMTMRQILWSSNNKERLYRLRGNDPLSLWYRVEGSIEISLHVFAIYKRDIPEGSGSDFWVYYPRHSSLLHGKHQSLAVFQSYHEHLRCVLRSRCWLRWFTIVFACKIGLISVPLAGTSLLLARHWSYVPASAEEEAICGLAR